LRISDTSRKTRLLATSLGDCVHVAGVRRFVDLAQAEGYETRFLGPAQPVKAVAEAVTEWQPDVLAISYRLTADSLDRLLQELLPLLAEQRAGGLQLIFGGPDPNCAVADGTGKFAATFGSATDDSVSRAYLRGEERPRHQGAWPQDLVARIEAKRPYPLLRHHFGQPTVQATADGAAEIAEASVLDVLSLGPDQNAQASFFRPEEMDPAQDGAGGVPLRTEDDFRRIYQATRTGNHPLVRCYSGTRDVVRMADILSRTINNAWSAIPLFWYNQLDMRSPRPLRESIVEAHAAMRWHAERGIPVEVNDSHQWSLRSAPDAVAVASFFLAAYNAKAAGVRDYVGQMMFNTPAGTTPAMDLAKMLAKMALTDELTGDGFRIWRETRTGLASMPADQDAAIGHMCGSIAMQLAVRPHILHVVSYTEAHHAATTADVIAAARMAQGVIDGIQVGLPEMHGDPRVIARRDQLITEGRLILSAIKEIAPPGTRDPWTDPETLARAVECGLMDAPDLAGNPAAWGKVRTRLVEGACRAVDEHGLPVLEQRRVADALVRAREQALTRAK
jgi:methylmalonyl-CoA mutase cobalamin-binding subunit